MCQVPKHRLYFTISPYLLDSLEYFTRESLISHISHWKAHIISVINKYSKCQIIQWPPFQLLGMASSACAHFYVNSIRVAVNLVSHSGENLLWLQRKLEIINPKTMYIRKSRHFVSAWWSGNSGISTVRNKIRQDITCICSISAHENCRKSMLKTVVFVVK